MKNQNMVSQASKRRRCAICGTPIEEYSPRAKYCSRCRNTRAGRHLSERITFRVTEEQKEVYIRFKEELLESWRSQLELLSRAGKRRVVRRFLKIKGRKK